MANYRVQARASLTSHLDHVFWLPELDCHTILIIKMIKTFLNTHIVSTYTLPLIRFGFQDEKPYSFPSPFFRWQQCIYFYVLFLRLILFANDIAGIVISSKPFSLLNHLMSYPSIFSDISLTILTVAAFWVLPTRPGSTGDLVREWAPLVDVVVEIVFLALSEGG